MHRFGMRAAPLPSPEPRHGFDARMTLPASPAPKRQSNFGFREPLFLPGSEDEFEMSVPLSPEPQGFGKTAPLSHRSPARSQRGDAARAVSLLPDAEDFRVLPVLDEGPSQTATHQPTDAEDSRVLPVPDEGPSQTATNQPTDAKEPLGSSSKERGEFRIAASYTHLTLARAVWKWGERAPSPGDRKPKGQTGTTGEAERMRESVCWAIPMPV